MANHLSFNPYDILELPYIWNINLHDLNAAYVNAQKKYHPDIDDLVDDDASIKVSQSYVALKDYTARGYALINALGWTESKLISFDRIYHLQSETKEVIITEWKKSFDLLDNFAIKTNELQFCHCFAEFIYIDKLRIRKKIIAKTF